MFLLLSGGGGAVLEGTLSVLDNACPASDAIPTGKPLRSSDIARGGSLTAIGPEITGRDFFLETENRLK